MKLYLVFLFVASVVATGKPRRPNSGPVFALDSSEVDKLPSKTADTFVGKPSNLDPADFTGVSWAVAPRINVINGESFYWVPIEVLTVEQHVVRMDLIIMKISVGESVCARDGSLNDINPTRCPLKKNGKRAVYEVKISTEKVKEPKKVVGAEKEAESVRSSEDNELIMN
ncbi:hypothetical protein CRE_16861 [Caenorhabditis remanei]|uniref:Uncharacterized protein n=1 Tax=Caenorhabditis remanei TaxID=31234 RepID=E3MSD6_CAERE|nr:hypothetical protein CRE_16861 [Caenorhabditis remanei]